ncbi:hypothetical protein Cgig2_026199 [Carnegiea gigantea]|uniref:Uncharacterized protein n=1 Tax=Carnegiea gigantea TaxID=171969 RepID=A0A9Q1GNM7_9CARY|nr:hypothetical protein Cgig2_026199 [Carnegiea gigantea]
MLTHSKSQTFVLDKDVSSLSSELAILSKYSIPKKLSGWPWANHQERIPKCGLPFKTVPERGHGMTANLNSDVRLSGMIRIHDQPDNPGRPGFTGTHKVQVSQPKRVQRVTQHVDPTRQKGLFVFPTGMYSSIPILASPSSPPGGHHHHSSISAAPSGPPLRQFDHTRRCESSSPAPISRRPARTRSHGGHPRQMSHPATNCG